jgi:hypothetical protein
MPGVDWFAALPCYDGREPAAGWVDKFQKTISVAGWSQAQALLVAEYKMVGDVRRWFQNYKATFTTVDIFAAAIKAEDPELKGSALMRLVNMKWQPGTSVRRYTREFKALARELDRSAGQQQLVDIFINSLSEPYLGAVMSADPHTLEEATTVAVTKEERYQRVAEAQGRWTADYRGASQWQDEELTTYGNMYSAVDSTYQDPFWETSWRPGQNHYSPATMMASGMACGADHQLQAKATCWGCDQSTYEEFDMADYAGNWFTRGDDEAVRSYNARFVEHIGPALMAQGFTQEDMLDYYLEGLADSSLLEGMQEGELTTLDGAMEAAGEEELRQERVAAHVAAYKQGMPLQSDYSRGDLVEINIREQGQSWWEGPYVVVSINLMTGEVEVAGDKARWPEMMEDVRRADIRYQVRDDAVPTDQGDDYSSTQGSWGAPLADEECLQEEQGVWSTWQDSDMSTPTGTSMGYVEGSSHVPQPSMEAAWYCEEQEALDDNWPEVEPEMEPEGEPTSSACEECYYGCASQQAARSSSQDSAAAADKLTPQGALMTEDEDMEPLQALEAGSGNKGTDGGDMDSRQELLFERELEVTRETCPADEASSEWRLPSQDSAAAAAGQRRKPMEVSVGYTKESIVGSQATQPHELKDYSTTKTFDPGGDCSFKIFTADITKPGRESVSMRAPVKAADGKASLLEVIKGYPISMPFDPGGAGVKTTAVEAQRAACDNYWRDSPGVPTKATSGVMNPATATAGEKGPGAYKLVLGPVTPPYIDPG